MQPEPKELVFLTVIAGRKQKDALLAALVNAGMQLVHTKYGKGTVKAGYLQCTLGLVPEEKKVLITCVSTRAKAHAALQMLVDRFHFDKPNTGIAFTLPMEKLSF